MRRGAPVGRQAAAAPAAAAQHRAPCAHAVGRRLEDAARWDRGRPAPDRGGVAGSSVRRLAAKKVRWQQGGGGGSGGGARAAGRPAGAAAGVQRGRSTPPAAGTLTWWCVSCRVSGARRLNCLGAAGALRKLGRDYWRCRASAGARKRTRGALLASAGPEEASERPRQTVVKHDNGERGCAVSRACSEPARMRRLHLPASRSETAPGGPARPCASTCNAYEHRPAAAGAKQTMTGPRPQQQ